MRQRRVRAWTEGSGLAGEPTSVDSRVESRASTEQQRQRHSLFVFFHFVVDSVQFFVDASTSFGFCPALNCSYRLSSVPETFSQSADSSRRRVRSTSLPPCTRRFALSLLSNFTSTYPDSFTLFVSPSLSCFVLSFNLSRTSSNLSWSYPVRKSRFVKPSTTITMDALDAYPPKSPNDLTKVDSYDRESYNSRERDPYRERRRSPSTLPSSH